MTQPSTGRGRSEERGEGDQTADERIRRFQEEGKRINYSGRITGICYADFGAAKAGHHLKRGER